MTEDDISEMPLTEDWGAGGDGQAHFLNHYNPIWINHFGSSLENPFENELCSCGGVYEKNIESHYRDETDEEQTDDPRERWKMEQEEMIKEYLSMAYRDLMQKKEMCGVKQERLRVAREELNAKLEALNGARSNTGDLNSAPTISNSVDGMGRVIKHSPEELRADVEMVRQRIKKLVLELVKMRSSVTMSEKGIDALMMVNKMISDKGRGGMQPGEAGEMVRGIRGMGASIKEGERRKRELMESVADLSQHFLSTNANWDPMSPSNDTFAYINAASQTELSGDMSKRYGTIAKLKLSLDQNKRCIMGVLEELIEVENQLIPCAIQFDANRVLLIEEKDRLLQELRRQRSPDSDGRIRDLEEDLYKVKEIFKRDVQLDRQRLSLTKKKVMLEEELLQRAKIGANLELHIKSLHQSMNSISSGSSLGSLGSLSASSKGSQNSLAIHDFYSMQELNKSIHQVNLPDLHSRVENIFHDQHPPPYRSLSALPDCTPIGSLAGSSSHLLSNDEINAQSFGEVGRSHQTMFQQYPTVQEETEEGDEGFEGLVEDEDNGGNLTNGARSDFSNASKPPPSYEDHLQLTGSVQTIQQPLSTCLYQQASRPQVSQRLNGCYQDGFIEKFKQPGQSYCLYQQPSQKFGMGSPIPVNTQKVCQRQDLYQQQAKVISGKLSVPQAAFTNNYSSYHSDNTNVKNMAPNLGTSADYSNACQKFYNYESQVPNNLLISNSLPSLFNASSVCPMTSCGSESQIFQPGSSEGSAFIYSVNQINNGRGQNIELPEMGNYNLKTDKLPTVSRSLLREFGVEKKSKIAAQLLDNNLVRNLQQNKEQLYSSNNIHLKGTPMAKSMESSFAVSMPTCHTAVLPETFSPKSSSTSHLHNFNEGSLLPVGYNCSKFFGKHSMSGGGIQKSSNLSNLSLSTSSLLDEGSNLGSDSGVFESANRLINVLSAQIHVQIMYDYCNQEVLVCIERVRNLSAVSIHSLNEVVFKVHILPFANYGSYVEDTDPSVPQHFLPSQSNIGKVFHFPVESEKVLSKTVQVSVLKLKDLNSSHQRSCSSLESVGISLISLASFDLKSCLSSWYNILCFHFMDADANKCLPVPSLTKNEVLDSNLSGESENEKKDVESKSAMRDESSDGSTVASSQTSTLTRVDELEDLKSNTKALVPQQQMPISESTSSKNSFGEDLERLDASSAQICDKETNTESQRVVPSNLPGFLRRPITPGSKLNRDTAIRRWQTFSPEGEDRTHKLSRSGSDSSVRRKNSHFDRHATNRQSIRLKMPLLATKRSEGGLDFSKNHTSIDLMVDFQSYKTKLETLNKEIIALQAIKQKLEEAKEKGETEPSWLKKNEELQALLKETSGTFREKAFDRRKLSDITDLANRKIRKVKMELLSLQARKSIGDIDRIMFKNKMNFFTSPDDSLSFLDQVETEIDDPISKDVENNDHGCSKTVESKLMAKNAPLSVKPHNLPGNNEASNFENMLF